MLEREQPLCGPEALRRKIKPHVGMAEWGGGEPSGIGGPLSAGPPSSGPLLDENKHIPLSLQPPFRFLFLVLGLAATSDLFVSRFSES